MAKQRKPACRKKEESICSGRSHTTKRKLRKAWHSSNFWSIFSWNLTAFLPIGSEKHPYIHIAVFLLSFRHVSSVAQWSRTWDLESDRPRSESQLCHLLLLWLTQAIYLSGYLLSVLRFHKFIKKKKDTLCEMSKIVAYSKWSINSHCYLLNTLLHLILTAIG